MKKPIRDCRKCEFWKDKEQVRFKNYKGVKIPEGIGRCMRPEGHCNPLFVKKRGVYSFGDWEIDFSKVKIIRLEPHLIEINGTGQSVLCFKIVEEDMPCKNT